MLGVRPSKLVFLMLVTMVFVKIYQHNLIIRLGYERQRLELKKDKLKKSENDLRRFICLLKNSEQTNNFVKNKLGMEKIKFSQIMTFSGT